LENNEQAKQTEKQAKSETQLLAEILQCQSHPKFNGKIFAIDDMPPELVFIIDGLGPRVGERDSGQLCAYNDVAKYGDKWAKWQVTPFGTKIDFKEITDDDRIKELNEKLELM
jgi:hypothetical protein